MIFIKILICFHLAFTFVKSNIQPQNSSTPAHPPKIYKFNLNLPAEKMWYEFISDCKQQIQEQVAQNNQSMNLGFIKNSLNVTRESVLNFHDQQYIQETIAIAKIAEVDFYDLFLTNNQFMFFAPIQQPQACTSIVIQNSQNEVFLGRNLDQPGGQLAGSIIAQGEFYKDGKLLYFGQVLAGMPGILTGMRLNEFAISIDARFGGYLYQNVQSFFANGSAPDYVLRKACENMSNFEEASNLLQNSQLIYNTYFIIAGNQVNQGSIIARNVDNYENITNLNGTSQWFLVETNYDLNIQPPKNDNRRQPAIDKLEKIGFENITIFSLFDDVISQTPNNNAWTVFSVMMRPQINYFNMTIWQ